MTTITRSVLLAGMTLVSAAVGGCRSGASTISGKVVRGDISFLVVVDSTDPRLKGEGLAGAKIEVGADRGAGLLGGSTSDAKGNFSIAIRDSSALLSPAEFSAELNGYTRTSSVMSIPASDKRLLVILKPGGAGKSK